MHFLASQQQQFSQPEEQEYQALEPGQQSSQYMENSPEFYASPNLLESKYHPQSYVKGYVRGKCCIIFCCYQKRFESAQLKSNQLLKRTRLRTVTSESSIPKITSRPRGKIQKPSTQSVCFWFNCAIRYIRNENNARLLHFNVDHIVWCYLSIVPYLGFWW